MLPAQAPLLLLLLPVSSDVRGEAVERELMDGVWSLFGVPNLGISYMYFLVLALTGERSVKQRVEMRRNRNAANTCKSSLDLPQRGLCVLFDTPNSLPTKANSWSPTRDPEGELNQVFASP